MATALRSGEALPSASQGEAQLAVSAPRAMAWRLSAAIAGLMAIQSAIGLLLPAVYRDTGWVTVAWFGNDLVTLFVAVPLLAWSLVAVRHGSRRAELVWYAMLGYGVYNYAYYLFGATINWLFPLYVALFTMPVFALILALGRLDARAVAADFSDRTRIGWIGAYMLFTGVGLSLAWTAQWLNLMLTGAIPQIGEAAFQFIAAMDLSFMVPWFVLGAVLLVRRRPWGYVIAPIIIMKGATYTLVLTASSTVGAVQGLAGAMEQVPIWGIWTLGGALALWALLGSVDGDRTA